MSYEGDPETNAFLSAFTRGLSGLGWTVGRNLRMEVRWAASSVDHMRRFAKELVGLQPDLILTGNTPVTAAFVSETRTIPIVIAAVTDPVGAGFIASLARPGGNVTGFTNLEGTMGGKWVELLMEIAPGVKRVAAMFNPETARYAATYYLAPFEAAARSFKIAPIVAHVHNDDEIEAVITSLGRGPGGGLVVMPDAFLYAHRASIITLAARNHVPAIYSQSVFTRDGGLLCYGADDRDLYYRAATYADRILRGAKPADLPVQLPTKFGVYLNTKTAKAFGLEVPPTLLAIADEVIE
jgi:putative ABC transport system substrate-binding protein